MRTVTALDLRSGAAIVLLATASCVLARPSDPGMEREFVDQADKMPVGEVPHGAVVFVEWAGRWARMLVR